MRENRTPHAFFFAPLNLRANRSMSDHSFAAPAKNPTCNRRPIADIETDRAQGFAPISNLYQVWNVEDAVPSRRDSISDRGRANGVLYRKCFEPDPEQLEPAT